MTAISYGWQRSSSLSNLAARAGGDYQLQGRLADGRVSRLDYQQAQMLAQQAHARSDGKVCVSKSARDKTRAADELVRAIGAQLPAQHPFTTMMETRKDNFNTAMWGSPQSRAASYMGGFRDFGFFANPAWCC